MSTIDPATLKQTAQTLLADGDELLSILEDLPLPDSFKAYVTKADSFVKDVEIFLQA